MLKRVRQYLNWAQNSVFEGELTQGQLDELLLRMNLIMKKEDDSVIIYKMQSTFYMKKQNIGVDKSNLTSNII